MYDSEFILDKLRGIASYQFGAGVGEALFPNQVNVKFSGKTGKIRSIYDGDELIAILRPLDGYFSLTLEGARRLIEDTSKPKYWVMASSEAAPFVCEGKNLFAKHVLDADEDIRPRDEVVIVNSEWRLLAVGRAVLSGVEMKSFKSGLAVSVRRGVGKEKVNEVTL